jgi:hypothetical protein
MIVGTVLWALRGSAGYCEEAGKPDSLVRVVESFERTTPYLGQNAKSTEHADCAQKAERAI